MKIHGLRSRNSTNPFFFCFINWLLLSSLSSNTTYMSGLRSKVPCITLFLRWREQVPVSFSSGRKTNPVDTAMSISRFTSVARICLLQHLKCYHLTANKTSARSCQFCIYVQCFFLLNALAFVWEVGNGCNHFETEIKWSEWLRDPLSFRFCDLVQQLCF